MIEKLERRINNKNKNSKQIGLSLKIRQQAMGDRQWAIGKQPQLSALNQK